MKCGQTLAERPDLIGDEAAGALKLLQGNNKPFPNEPAWEARSPKKPRMRAAVLLPSHRTRPVCPRSPRSRSTCSRVAHALRGSAPPTALCTFFGIFACLVHTEGEAGDTGDACGDNAGPVSGATNRSGGRVAHSIFLPTGGANR